MSADRSQQTFSVTCLSAGQERTSPTIECATHKGADQTLRFYIIAN